MQFLQRIRLLREFNAARRAAAEAHPEYGEEECCADALDQLKAKYGASPDWPKIFQLLIEFLLKFLPFLFLNPSEEE